MTKFRNLSFRSTSDYWRTNNQPTHMYVYPDYAPNTCHGTFHLYINLHATNQRTCMCVGVSMCVCVFSLHLCVCVCLLSEDKPLSSSLLFLYLWGGLCSREWLTRVYSACACSYHVPDTTYTRTHTRLSVITRTHTYTYMHTHTHSRTHTHADTQTHRHTDIQTYRHTDTHT